MKKLFIPLIVLAVTLSASAAEAFSLGIGYLFTHSITQTSMVVSVNTSVPEYNEAIQAGRPIYLNYRTTMCGDDRFTAPNTVCPAVYQQPMITPFNYSPISLPTYPATRSLSPIYLQNLTPGTQYTLWISYNNDMQCFTTPCPSTTEDFQNRILVTTLSGSQNNQTSLQFSNVGNTSATVNVSIGNDMYQQYAQQRYGLIIRYVRSDLSFDSMETARKHLVYSNDVISSLPATLTGLMPNTSYKVSLGYQPPYSCVGNCITVIPQPLFTDTVWTFTTTGYGNSIVLTQRLYKGIQSSEVVSLQKYLIAAGYLNDYADGKFGNKTHLAVMAFQRAHGLSTDGRVGPQTRAVINSKINNFVY